MRRARGARVVGVVACLVVLGGCHLIESSTNRTVTKVLVVGDSVINWATPAIRTMYAPQAEVEYVGALSSGPLTNQKQWANDLRTKLATYKADLVIFEACCHYEGKVNGQPGPLFVNADGVTVQPDTELMYSELAAADAELVQIARTAGASPYWVKLPPGNANTSFYGPTFPTRIDRFNTIIATLGVPILDWGAAVSSQPNADDLRAIDGVHYTDAGNTFVANFTFASTVKLVP